MAQPPESPNPQIADDPSVGLARAQQRRAEIATALKSIRRRNRAAAIGLAASCLAAIGGVVGLWWWKSNQSEDPIALKLRSPIEFRSPFEFVRSKPGAPGDGASGKSGAGAPTGSSDAGSPAK